MDIVDLQRTDEETVFGTRVVPVVKKRKLFNHCLIFN